jgi:hypothetical protein
MPYRKTGKSAEPQSILKNRTASSPDKLEPDQAIQLAGLVAAAVRNQNACYIQPGKYGSVMVKFYIEGDQFAENLVLNDQLEELCEQIVEALYTQDDVGWNRRTFGTARSERPSAARKGADGTKDTGA